MTRRFWLVVALVAVACVAAAVLFKQGPSEALPPAPAPDPETVAAVAPAPVATPAPAEARAKPAVGYDRYRAEMERIRAARKEAQALQPNERCINRERYRKVGTGWERAGNC